MIAEILKLKVKVRKLKCGNTQECTAKRQKVKQNQKNSPPTKKGNKRKKIRKLDQSRKTNIQILEISEKDIRESG